MQKINILIVEDDPLYQLELEMGLSQLSYVSYHLVDNAADALTALSQHTFGLILLDIHLNGQINGIELAGQLRKATNFVPIVFMTSNGNDENYEQAKPLLPYAFLVKPIDVLTLRSTIDAVVSQRTYTQAPLEQFQYSREAYQLKEHLFVKTNNKLYKIKLSEIQVIEADGNYSLIYVGSRKYVMKLSLKQLLLQLGSLLFIRIHRNYVVQIPHIQSVDFSHNEISIRDETYPIGNSYKRDLADRLTRIS